MYIKKRPSICSLKMALQRSRNMSIIWSFIFQLYYM